MVSLREAGRTSRSYARRGRGASSRAPELGKCHHSRGRTGQHGCCGALTGDDGRMRARRIAPWVGRVLTVAGVVFALVLNALAGSHGEETWTGVAWASRGTGVERGGAGARHPAQPESDRVAAAGERAGAGRASGRDPLRGLHGSRGSGRAAGRRVGRPLSRARVADAVRLRDRDRPRIPRRPAALAEVAPGRDRGGGVVRGADRGVSAVGGALQRGVRPRLQPTSRAVRVRGRAPLHDQRPWGAGRTGGGGPGRSGEDEAGIARSSACSSGGSRSRRTRSRRGGGQPDRELDHRQRGRGDDDRLGRWR